MDDVRPYLILLFAVAAFASWLLAAVEVIGPPLPLRALFRLGPVLLADRLESAPDPSWARQGAVLRTRSLLGASTGVELRFRPRVTLRGNPYRLPVKGTLSLAPPWKVEVRGSLGAMAFLSLWLGGWLLGSAMFVLAQPLLGIPFGLLGVGFAAGFLWYLQRGGANAASRVLADLSERLEHPADEA